jgi:cyclophilin family peptidyl-prolyl cis-trans isomerase/predicted small lipoprotein YifL
MKRSIRIMVTVAVVIIALLSLAACGQEKTPDRAPAASEDNEKPTSWSEAPAMAIDPAKSYTAKFQTSKGNFEVELFADSAPITVNNFVFLARQGFYEGVTFHRIVETFMIQTGDPLGTGTGGPGYTIQDELENTSTYKYEPGILAMARTRAPNSAGSQFFICTGLDASTLTPDYAIFGKVVEGMETVNAIAKTPVGTGHGGEQSKPLETVTIQKIEIVES